MINSASEAIEKGCSQYVLHSSAALQQDDGRLIGEVLFTRYDAESAEADGTSPRFIARPDSYLAKLHETLFDPTSPVARLPQLIREDLPRGSGKIIILDDLCLDASLKGEPALNILIDTIRDLGPQADLIVIPKWTKLGIGLGIPPVDMMRALQRFGIVSFQVRTLIGFCEDFALHEENDRLRQAMGPQ